jgi:CO dehydrogenase nickel-insertion accessory protein CooC1
VINVTKAKGIDKMKISVCGKGGSGKSTLVTLLANQALARNLCVLVVDSDESNLGLFRMLGFRRSPVPLMELVGGKKSLKEKMGQPNILAEKQNKRNVDVIGVLPDDPVIFEACLDGQAIGHCKAYYEAGKILDVLLSKS